MVRVRVMFGSSFKISIFNIATESGGQIRLATVLKTVFITVSYLILVASLTLMALF